MTDKTLLAQALDLLREFVKLRESADHTKDPDFKMSGPDGLKLVDIS